MDGTFQYTIRAAFDISRLNHCDAIYSGTPILLQITNLGMIKGGCIRDSSEDIYEKVPALIQISWIRAGTFFDKFRVYLTFQNCIYMAKVGS